MRSLVQALTDRFTNLQSPGTWNNTTFAKVPSASNKSVTNAGAQMASYGAVSTLFAVVNKISNSTGSVKWRLYRPKKDGRRVTGPNDLERPEIVSHVALDLWERPNPFYTSAHFTESFMQHVLLTGEAFLMVGRSDMSSMPLELWTIRPDKIEVVPSVEEFIAGYVYTGPNDEKIPLSTDEIIHIKMPNPLDPYRGLGPVQALMVDLESSKFAGQFNRNFFMNDASPGGIIEIEQRLSDSEWQEFVERWRYQHQGVNNAHRIATLENGATWKDRQFTMRDMQFTELRELSDKQILKAFGMHGHLLGVAEDINRANAEAAEDTFARWVLVPHLDRIKDALNFQLLKLFGSSGVGVEFDFDDPSLEDSEATNNSLTAKANAAQTLIAAGFDKASVLEAVGLPDIEVDAIREEQAQLGVEGAKKALEAPETEQKSLPPGKAETNGHKPKEPAKALSDRDMQVLRNVFDSSLGK